MHPCPVVVSVLQTPHGGDGGGLSAWEGFGCLPVFVRFGTKKGDDILEGSRGLQPQRIHDVTQVICNDNDKTHTQVLLKTSFIL